MNVLEQKTIAIKMIDWLQAEGVPSDDAAPILAMTIGLIIGKQARDINRVEEGVSIMSKMITVAAMFEVKQKGARHDHH